MESIIDYLISKGGIWGLLLALSLAWIVFRENSWLKSNTDDKLNLDISIKSLLSKHDSTDNKIEEISKAITDFKDINHRQAKAARALQEKLQEVNDERIDELKEIEFETSYLIFDLRC